jgi:hypothetical protein
VQEQQYLPAPDWQFAPPTSLSEPASCHTSSAIYTHNAGRIVCVQLSIEYNLIKGETSYASILYGWMLVCVYVCVCVCACVFVCACMYVCE